MIKTAYRGDFYLPDKNKYPGQIYYHEDRIILEILSKYSLDKIKIEPDLSNDVKFFHKIIYGETTTPYYMTLLDCRWIETSPISINLYSIKYDIRLIIKNVLLKSYEDFKLNSAVVCLPYVASWYDGWKWRDKLDYFSTYQIENESISLRINENFTLDFIDKLVKYPKVFGKKFELEYYKFVQFKYNVPVHYYDLISDIISFKKLLEFSTSKKIGFELIEGKIDNSNIISEDIHFKSENSTLIYFKDFQFINGYNVDDQSLHEHYMLISNWKINKDELNDIIVRWFSKKSFYPIYDLYLDSNNWFENSNAILSHVMFNNRCLNMIQALEDFHRKMNIEFNPDKAEFDVLKAKVLKALYKDKELKKWANNQIKFSKVPYLKDRLNDLINNTIEIIKEVFGDKDFFKLFPDLAKKYRDILSHAKMEDTDLGDEFLILFDMSQIFLAICILKNLELDDSLISKLIKENLDFKRKIRHLKKARP